MYLPGLWPVICLWKLPAGTPWPTSHTHTLLPNMFINTSLSLSRRQLLLSLSLLKPTPAFTSFLPHLWSPQTHLSRGYTVQGSGRFSLGFISPGSHNRINCTAPSVCSCLLFPMCYGSPHSKTPNRSTLQPADGISEFKADFLALSCFENRVG